MQGVGHAYVVIALAGLGAACSPAPETPETRGLVLTQEVGCGACHRIPGIAWPQGVVGPPLDAWSERALIAGRYPNTPDNLSRWVRDAPSMSAETGMPPMPLDEAEADAVAAYLLSLK